MPAQPRLGNTGPARVAAIVPARNEADVIARSLHSLLQQEYSGKLRVFLVDDGSADRTALLAREIARTDDRLRVITGWPVPPGWTGKTWAMQQGWEASQAMHPDFVWLTDADIEHQPEQLSRLLSIAASGFDLVSWMVRLHCRSFAEKLLVPAFVYFFFLIYPPRWVSGWRTSIAGAAGGCILARAERLKTAGAFASIRGELIDDCHLAQRVKHAGGRIWLGTTQDSRSIRTHDGLSGLLRMISRTAFNQLHHSALLLIACLAGMLLLFVSPFASLLAPDLTIRMIGISACLLMFVSFMPVVRHHSLSIAYTLALPVAAMFYAHATIHSAVSYWRGHGGQWKGRSQDPHGAQATQ